MQDLGDTSLLLASSGRLPSSRVDAVRVRIWPKIIQGARGSARE